MNNGAQDPVFKHYEEEIHQQMQAAVSSQLTRSDTRGKLPHNVNLKFGRPDQDATSTGRYCKNSSQDPLFIVFCTVLSSF